MVTADWRSRPLDSSHLPIGPDGPFCFVATVLEVLAAQPEGLCLECVLTKTGLRADQAFREIAAASLRVADGRCGGCGAAGPVFAHATGGFSG